MKYLKNAFFLYSSFSEKSGRVEYGIYLFLVVLLHLLALHLQQTINLDNQKILNFFYICFIVLFTFVPMQAVTIRRLKDLNATPTFVIFNFIPLLNIIFIIFLLVAKKPSKVV